MLEIERFELRRDGVSVHVEPQVFDVLAYLIEHRHRVVPKTELLDNVWGDRFVSESALSSRLKSARRAVGDDGASQRVIRTVFGRGYQFVAEVTVWATNGKAPHGDGGVDHTAVEDEGFGPLRQSIHLCRSADGAQLAYATMGDGPVLVKAANWMTHLDYDGETPVWRHWLDGLAAGRTLVRYDERGCGMSDWDVEAFEFEDWVDDLTTVVDDIGLEQFPLLGVSQGAAVAVAFAARNPERVEKLVLSRVVRPGPAGASDVTGGTRRRRPRRRGGAGRLGARRFVVPSDVHVAVPPRRTREEWDQFDELLRRTISPDNAARFLQTFARIDVTAIAPQVTCPTLVLHSRDDRRVAVSAGREMAALIPGSRFVPLPSRNHLLRSTEPAWPLFLAAIDDFLAPS